MSIMRGLWIGCYRGWIRSWRYVGKSSYFDVVEDVGVSPSGAIVLIANDK